jgi:hypothetical protein
MLRAILTLKATVAIWSNAACTPRMVGAGNLCVRLIDRRRVEFDRLGIGGHEMASVCENAEVDLMDLSYRHAIVRDLA